MTRSFTFDSEPTVRHRVTCFKCSKPAQKKSFIFLLKQCFMLFCFVQIHLKYIHYKCTEKISPVFVFTFPRYVQLDLTSAICSCLIRNHCTQFSFVLSMTCCVFCSIIADCVPRWVSLQVTSFFICKNQKPPQKRIWDWVGTLKNIILKMGCNESSQKMLMETLHKCC